MLVPVASVHIRARTIGDGTRRYDVRYRRGGKFFAVEHAGTFRTRKEADRRAERVRLWLAEAKDPKRELEAALGHTSLLFNAAHDAWLKGRRGVSDRTLESLKSRRDPINDVFGHRAPGSITHQAVSEWVGELAETKAAGTVKAYVAQLRAVLDYAGVDPNPARDRRVELPRKIRSEPEPPDADDVLAVLNRAPFKHRLCLVVLEQTGARVGEATMLTRQQLDVTGRRLLVRGEQSKTGRPRWLDLKPWLVDLLEPLQGRLFPASRQAVYMAIRNGGGDWGPHALRHRRATLWHQQGVPHAELARRLGHSRPSMSLEVYAHVMPLREIPAGSIVHSLNNASTSTLRT